MGTLFTIFPALKGLKCTIHAIPAFTFPHSFKGNKAALVLYIHVICFDLKVDSARQERYTTHWYYWRFPSGSTHIPCSFWMRTILNPDLIAGHNSLSSRSDRYQNVLYHAPLIQRLIHSYLCSRNCHECGKNGVLRNVSLTVLFPLYFHQGTGRSMILMSEREYFSKRESSPT